MVRSTCSLATSELELAISLVHSCLKHWTVCAQVNGVGYNCAPALVELQTRLHRAAICARIDVAS